MTVMLVSAVDPYPVDAGKKVVLAGFVDYFRERYGPGGVHYLLVGGRPPERFPVTLHHVPGPGRLTAVGNVALRATTGRSSIQEALLRSRAVGHGIDRIREQVRPSRQVYDTVRMAQYADESASKQVCYLDDLFSERYTAMLAAARRFPDVDIRPLGNFAAHVPSPLRPIADNRHGRNALLRTERRLVRRSEDRVATTFGTSLLISEAEAVELAARTGVSRDRVRSLPPLVRLAPGGANAERREPEAGRPVFVFLGLLSLPHNDDGLTWLLSEIWPLVLRALPGARLRVIGREASEALRALAGRYGDSVSVEGFVEDFNGALADASAMLNPLRFGSGIKLKVIEALARGIPVVSTTVGAEGIVSGADAGILVADEPAAICAQMCELTSPGHNARIARASAAHFDAVYSRPAVFAAYDRAFG